MEHKTAETDREIVRRFVAHAATLNDNDHFDSDLVARYLEADDRLYDTAVDMGVYEPTAPAPARIEFLTGALAAAVAFSLYLAFTM